jgi:hypothetical protein
VPPSPLPPSPAAAPSEPPQLTSPTTAEMLKMISAAANAW